MLAYVGSTFPYRCEFDVFMELRGLCYPLPTVNRCIFGKWHDSNRFVRLVVYNMRPPTATVTVGPCHLPGTRYISLVPLKI